MNRPEVPQHHWNKILAIWRIIDRLRGESGCPWDRKQTPETVQTYLIEEAHEAAAAVRAGHDHEVAEELGDLLFVVVNMARHLGVDAESALDRTADKFQQRFRTMERMAEEQNRSLED